MRRRIMKQEFLVLVLCAVFLCQGAAAGSLFYEGGMTVNTIRADVDIGSTADAEIVYMLVNTGNAREQAALQAAAGSGQVQNIVLEPGQQTEVRFRYTVSPAGDKVRTLALDPAVLFNGKPPAERVRNISVTLKLPPGVPALISSNRDFIAGTSDGAGRVQFAWSAKDIYPTTISAKWSTLGTNLIVEKMVTPPEITVPNQECTVTLTLANKGNTAVKNILLRDTFASSDFEGVSPMEEFVVKEGNETRQRIIWEKVIPSLPAGQNATIQYRVRYIGQTAQVNTFQIQPTEVYAGGSLVASSGRVTLHQLTGAVRAVEKTLTPKPALPLGAEVIIASLFLGAWLRRNGKKE
jgi:hypothetical protein